MIMKCSLCGEPMQVQGEPQISVAPVIVKEQKYPTKLICSLMTIYACDKCPVKAVYTEIKEYVPSESECKRCTDCNQGKAE